MTTAPGAGRGGTPWWVELAASLPVLVAGVAVLWFPFRWLAQWWGIPVAGLWAGWLALGALRCWRPVEWLEVALRRRVRWPSAAERLRLDRLLAEVSARAGSQRSWVVAIQETSAVNAAASGVHIVYVAAGALALHDVALSSILAHELGHHFAYDTVTGRVRSWFSMPVRWVSTTTRWVGFALATVMGSGVGYLLGVVVMALGWLVVLPLVCTWPLDRWLSRRNELAADAVATRLGYGPVQLALFEALDDGTEPSWWQRVRSTHPSLAVRHQAVLDQLAATGEVGPR